jgi:hypothetical protein
MDGGIILSDNAHSSPVLEQVAARHGRQYSLFVERPRAHFYEGAGIGMAR